MLFLAAAVAAIGPVVLLATGATRVRTLGATASSADAPPAS
jgi:hypothetical protein